MKALSLWQPWAHAVVHLGKRIENRERWPACNYRGPLLIHASVGFGGLASFHEASTMIERVLSRAGRDDEWTRLVVDDRIEARDFTFRPGHALPRGGIIGRCRVDGVICDERDFQRVADADAQRGLWWFGGFALVLANVEPLPLIPWKGKQGFFEVPDDVIARAVAQGGAST